MTLIKASGRISVDKERGRVALEMGRGIVDYYQSFLEKIYWVKFSSPRYSAHISLFNPKFNRNIDWKYAESLKGKRVSFYYDPDMVRGGRMKGFVMYYFKIYSVELEIEKKKMGIVEPESYRGLHLTLGQVGKNGGAVQMYWPEMITI